MRTHLPRASPECPSVATPIVAVTGSDKVTLTGARDQHCQNCAGSIERTILARSARQGNRAKPCGEGDKLIYRFERAPMKAEMPRPRSGREFSALRTGGQRLRQVEIVPHLRKTGQRRRSANYCTAPRKPRSTRRPGLHQPGSRQFTPWEPISPDSDVLVLTKACTVAWWARAMDVAALVRLLIAWCRSHNLWVDSRRIKP